MLRGPSPSRFASQIATGKASTSARAFTGLRGPALSRFWSAFHAPDDAACRLRPLPGCVYRATTCRNAYSGARNAS